MIEKLRAEFRQHIEICGACADLKSCWKIDEICKKLIDAGIFR